ncbi:MAG: lamin tail domain-containing protein [Phycisphaerales bacterium]|nr:MAG: lamin tail domain-containing protein [Phycisphaerales bacterium]
MAERVSHMASKASDAAVPATPIVTSLAVEGFPVNTLTFQTSPFGDPQGANTFAAMKWRLAEVEPGAVVTAPRPEGTILLADQSRWKYFKGTQEPPTSPVDWRDTRFDDAAWLSGTTPIGYGETFIATNLGDMRGRYSTFYVRKEFNLTDPETLGRLRIEAMFDDGIKVWINGSLAASNNAPAGDLPHTATTNNRSENHSFTSIATIDASQYLVTGTNVVAAQLVNQSLGDSSDCFFDIRLTAEPEDPTAEPPAAGPVNYTRKPRKYEIDAIWESEELTEFSDNITIPAALVRPGRTYRVRCRMADTSGRWSHWSAPIQFVAGEPLAVGIVADLRITEVMYNPGDGLGDDGDEYEFIELKNIGDETLDLSTVSLVDGVAFDFADSDVTVLGPGQFVLVVRNRDAFLARYGATLADLVAGEYDGRLGNAGETVRLDDFWNGTIAEFVYGDSRGWPLTADGAGHSLVPLASAMLQQPAGSLRYGGNWRASAYLGGSPGADDPDLEAMVVINEFLAGGGGDWIELYNATDGAVDLTDYYLSDDADDLTKWAVAAPAIAAGDFLTFEESGDDLGFGLSRSGEQLFLSHLPGTAEDRIVDSVRFKAQEEGVSLGRYPDGEPWWLRAEPTPDAANVTPLADVVIDEVMYHPVDANDEYIELFNPTDTAIELAGPAGPWRLNGGIEYSFAPGQSLEPGGRLVVVDFSPLADFDRLGEFVLSYADELLIPGVDIVGPWQGSLNSAGERLALEKPLATDDPNDPDWAIVDEVIYSDVAPWPTGPDGQGEVLQRQSVEPAGSGNDPANWQGATPSPAYGW